jgi:predicted O-methyltransferase YrrM
MQSTIKIIGKNTQNQFFNFMKFNYYFRKSSFKKDINSANLLLRAIETHKPKNFLEVGVFQGVTSRNVCEKLYEINGENFSFHGIDLFEDTNSNIDNKEMTIKHNKISNPFKHLIFNIILKKELFSINSIYKFLKKFKDKVNLYKGFSDTELPKIDMSKIDMVFLDGGHSYETVKNDLILIIKGIKKGKIIICDDYNQVNYGVKKAVDELINQVHEIKELNKRLVQITV